MDQKQPVGVLALHLAPRVLPRLVEGVNGGRKVGASYPYIFRANDSEPSPQKLAVTGQVHVRCEVQGIVQLVTPDRLLQRTSHFPQVVAVDGDEVWACSSLHLSAP